MPHITSIIPPIPAAWLDQDEEARRRREALSTIATRTKLPPRPPGDDYEASLRWAAESIGAAKSPQDRIEANKRVQGVAGPEAQEAAWKKALTAISLPFDAFAEGASALVSALPVPQPAIFRERGAKSRAIIADMFGGRIDPAHAAGLLREAFQQRSTIEQLILGITLDPTTLVPGALVGKLAIKAGAKGVLATTARVAGQAAFGPVISPAALVRTGKLTLRQVGARVGEAARSELTDEELRLLPAGGAVEELGEEGERRLIEDLLSVTIRRNLVSTEKQAEMLQVALASPAKGARMDAARRALLIHLPLNEGVRETEAAAITFGAARRAITTSRLELLMPSGALRVVPGGGAPLRPETIAALQAAIATNPSAPDTAKLFTHITKKQGKDISASAELLGSEFQAIARAAGLAIRWTDLRATSADAIAEAAARTGGSPRLVATMMGHSSFITTHKYYIASLGDMSRVPDDVRMDANLATPNGLKADQEAIGRANELLARAAALGKAEKVARRKGREAAPKALKAEAQAQTGIGKVLSLPLDAGTEQRLLQWPESIRPFARITLQLEEATDYLRRGTTTFDIANQRVLEMNKVRERVRRQHGNFEVMEESAKRKTAIAERTNIRTQLTELAIGVKALRTQLLRQASPDPRKWATAADAVMDTAPDPAAIRILNSNAETFADTWLNSLRSPFAGVGARALMKLAKEWGIDRAALEGAAIIHDRYEQASDLVQRQEAFAFITHPGVRKALKHFHLSEVVHPKDEQKLVFYLERNQPMKALKAIAAHKTLQNVFGLDFGKLDAPTQEARLNALGRNLLLNNANGDYFITDAAYEAKLKSERLSSPLNLAPAVELPEGQIAVDVEGVMDMKQVVGQAQSVAEIVLHGSKPRPFLQRLLKVEDATATGKAYVAARRVVEMVAGRGALANEVGKVLLGFGTSIQEGVDLARRAVTILRPTWEPMRAKYKLADNTFDLELQPNATDSAIVQTMRDLLGNDAPVRINEVMRHQATVLAGVPIERLNDIYVLTREQYVAIVSLRNAAAQATANLAARFPRWYRRLTQGKTKDELNALVIHKLLPYYFPTLAAKAGPLPRPGFATLEATFLHNRIIDNAADAIRKGVQYNDPMVALERYIAETSMVAAEEELRIAMKPFVQAAEPYHYRAAQAKGLENLRLRVAAGDTKLADVTPATLHRLQTMFGTDQVSKALGSKAGAEEMREFVQDAVRMTQKRHAASIAISTIKPDIKVLEKMPFDETTSRLVRDWLVDGNKEWTTIARTANAGSAILRVLRSGLDFSVIGIHGMMTLALHPEEWARASARMVEFIAKGGPGTASHEARKLMAARQLSDPATADFTRYGGVIGGFEVTEALSTKGGQLLKGVPGLGGLLDRAEGAFTIWLNEARTLMWKGLRNKAKNEAELFELAASVNKMTGTYNTVLAGMPQLQRYLEGAIVSFAPTYRRAAYGLIADVFAGINTLRGREALKAVGALLGAGFVFGMMIKASGNNDKALDPTSPRFMAVRIGNVYIGLGTAYYSLIRLGANIVDKAMTDPRSFLSPDPRDSALWKYWRSQAAPLSGLGMDFIIGSTYTGDPLRNDDGFMGPQVLAHLGFQMTPFVAEDIVRAVTTDASFEAPAYISEGVGLRAFPVSLYERRDWLRKSFMEMDGELAGWRASHPTGTWDELPVLMQRELWNRHPEIAELEQQIEKRTLVSGRAAQQRITRYIIEVRGNTDQADLRLQAAARTFDRGFLAESNKPVDGRWFRDEVGTVGAVLRALHQQSEARHQEAIEELEQRKLDRTDKTAVRLDVLFEDYMRKVTLNPDFVNDDGFFMADRFEMAEHAWRVRYGEEAYKYVRERLRVSRDFPPTMLEYVRGKEQLKDYWHLTDRLWARDSWQHTLVSHNLSIPTRQRDEHKRLFPQVVPLLKRLEEARKRWRLAHPEEDWLLVRFYDRIPVAPANILRLRTWEAQRASPLRS